MKVKGLLASAAAAIAIGSVTIPARADVPYQGAAVGALSSLLADTCIPVGYSEYCVQFTSAQYQTALNMLAGQNQMGQMMSLGLKQVNTQQLSSHLGDSLLGVNRHTQQTSTISNADPNVAADTAAQGIISGMGYDPNDYQSWLDTVSGETSPLAVQQDAAMIQLKGQLSALNAQNFAAAQQLQDTANGKRAVQTATSAMDLSGDPTTGWSL